MLGGPHSGNSSSHRLIPAVYELFEKLYDRRLLIRLIGVRFSKLLQGQEQLNLFDDGAKLVPLHIKDVTDKEQYELLKMRKMSQDYYRIKGEGRPTKKDRRDMDDYVENDIASDFTDWDDFFGEKNADDSDD